jgi:23S rRNA pseudouridine1911/1915/1917 synthase
MEIKRLSDKLFEFTYEGEKGERLDKYLVVCLPDFSRSRLQGLIGDGFVTVNGTPVTKSGAALDTGQTVQIRIPPAEPTDLIPENISLDVIFENEQLMIFNKPAGMVVHPAAGHPTGTLVQAALAHAPELEGIGGEQRPGVVHRLDKDTSGLIVMAKDERTHRWLQDQFRLRKVRKIYWALVDGVPPTPTGRVEASIGRDPAHRKQMAVVPDGKGREAVSEYRTLEKFPAHTLLEVHPLTGRTHQIRLHLKFIGCPIVADTLYGHKHPSLPLQRQFLHAGSLSITLPGEKQPRTFEAPLPDDLAKVLADLRKS